MKLVRRTLADGTVKTYRYEQRVKIPRQNPGGALRSIFNRYSASPEFQRMAPKWQAYKALLMRQIEEEFGWMGIKHLESRKARTEFYALRDRCAATSLRHADFLMQTLSSALGWAYDRGIVEVNHAMRIETLSPRAPRAEKYYTAEMIETILARAPQDLATLFQFALYTGLRRGDIANLTAENIGKDGWLVLKPHKTLRSSGCAVHLPLFALPPLNKLSAGFGKAGPLLTTQNGLPWQEHNISIRWAAMLGRIGIEDRTFHDIRRTTATLLIEAGCTEAERGTIMGHAVAQGSGIAYVARTRELALNAYAKWANRLEGGTVINFGARRKTVLRR